MKLTYRSQQASQLQAIQASGNTNLSAQIQAVSGGTPCVTPAAMTVSNVSYSSDASYLLGSVLGELKHCWHLGLVITGEVMEVNGRQV